MCSVAITGWDEANVYLEKLLTIWENVLICFEPGTPHYTLCLFLFCARIQSSNILPLAGGILEAGAVVWSLWVKPADI